MVALQIRDVPEDVRDVLAERARARGQSLQAFLLSLVKDEARRSRNILLLKQFEGRTDGASLTLEEVTREFDELRGRRETDLNVPPESDSR
jgi:antitoxin FitA